MPLIIAPLNVVLKVIKILLDDKTKKHLESLGITIDSEIKILECSGGSVIIAVKDGRLALDSNIATKILVR
ncbi:MAG: ferrous iron transport protein A [Mollicutes bacterium]|nr:ferrous iron transport protein A [Mollicutes bacterium]MDD7264474.1 FeoA family protein [bacterium]MDY4979528.1 FeoA family protein [Candidatus Onthovivens sp.]